MNVHRFVEFALHRLRRPMPDGAVQPLVVVPTDPSQGLFQTRATDFQGPGKCVALALNRPMMLSAKALSQLSPTQPAEVSMPVSA
jgi:hypothetical protein